MLALALVLLSQVQPDSRVTRVERVPGGRVPGGRVSSPAGVPLCDALQAGDKVGSWWCMNGDGSMSSGSSVTLVATGTPTNSTENGRAVRTYTAAQNDQEPSNVAFPASDFSACYHRRSDALPNVQIMAFGTSGSGAGYASLPFEQQTNGNVSSYISNGATGAPFTSVTALSAGAWYLLCFTYERIGAGTSVGRLYLNGVQINSSSSMNLAQALSSVWSTNGYATATGGSAGSTRGVFVTYKLLSPADIARVSARTAR